MEKAKKWLFFASVDRVMTIVSLISIFLIMGAMIFAFIKSPNGDGIIALLSLAILFYTLIIKEQANPYKKSIFFMVVTCVASCILAFVFVFAIPELDLNKYSIWISAVGLLSTFFVEWRKIGKQLVKKDKEAIDKRRAEVTKLSR